MPTILPAQADVNLKGPVSLPALSTIAKYTGTLPVVHTPQDPP